MNRGARPDQPQDQVVTGTSRLARGHQPTFTLFSETSMRFTKITANERGAHLEWTTPAEQHPETKVEHLMDGDEGAHPDFITALQDFVPEVIKLLELPTAYTTGLTVTSLSMNYKSDRLGLVVTCQKKLERSNSPFVIHTPHLREANDEETGEYLSDEVVALVQKVEKFAAAYVSGARAQGELFEQAGSKA